MNQWLNGGNTPALVYIRDSKTWASVNSETELLSWTDDPKEIAWLSDWAVNQQNQKKEHPSSGSPNIVLQQSTARQSLFPATQFELSEAIRLSFRCDNHDVAHVSTICPAVYRYLNCG